MGGTACCPLSFVEPFFGGAKQKGTGNLKSFVPFRHETGKAENK